MGEAIRTGSCLDPSICRNPKIFFYAAELGAGMRKVKKIFCWE
jgi:hypothetical protein